MRQPALSAALAVLLTAWVAGCRHRSNHAPQTPDSPVGPVRVGLDTVYGYKVRLTDPDNDTLCCRFDWGDGDTSDWSAFVASGDSVRMTHCWTDKRTFEVRAQARDGDDSVSGWSVPLVVSVCDSHSVRWCWQSGPCRGAASAPLVVSNGGEHLVYFAGEDGRFYAVSLDGQTRYVAGSVDTFDGGSFTGQPAYCAATGHIVVGNEEGELYGFTRSLELAWHWPGNSSGHLFDWLEWGAPAIAGDRVYVARQTDEPGDRLYCFVDLGNEVAMVASYDIPNEESAVHAPVVDADGRVLLVTVDGYVIKLSPDLDTVVWSMYVSDDELCSPSLGADGTIYCATLSGSEVNAIHPEGSWKWEAAVDGAWWPAVGESALFLATDARRVQAHDLYPGESLWTTETGSCLTGCPVLAANGLLYCPGTESLYCLRQRDGQLRWTVSLDPAGPAESRRDVEEFEPNLTIAPNGDILVPTWHGLYCVVGYPDAPLADAPWPKWQRDAHNTGSAVRTALSRPRGRLCLTRP